MYKEVKRRQHHNTFHILKFCKQITHMIQKRHTEHEQRIGTRSREKQEQSESV